MTNDDLQRALHALAAILDANAQQRITVALARGILLELELALRPALINPPGPPPA